MEIEYQEVSCPQCHRFCASHGRSSRFIGANRAHCSVCYIIVWYNKDIRKYALINGLGPIEGKMSDKFYDLVDFERILKLKAFI